MNYKPQGAATLNLAQVADKLTIFARIGASTNMTVVIQTGEWVAGT